VTSLLDAISICVTGGGPITGRELELCCALFSGFPRVFVPRACSPYRARSRYKSACSAGDNRVILIILLLVRVHNSAKQLSTSQIPTI